MISGPKGGCKSSWLTNYLLYNQKKKPRGTDTCIMQAFGTDVPLLIDMSCLLKLCGDTDFFPLYEGYPP